MIYLKEENNIIMSSDKLYYYSKSKDVPPGKGIYETINDIKDYEELAKIKDWRKILSNFHLCPFEYKEYTYNSIEHAFQSQKIALVSPEKAYLFTIESGDDIGKGDENIARKNRKLIKLNTEILTKWNKIKNVIMYEIMLSKYKICSEAAKVLKATGKAELWHIISRSKVHYRIIQLEKIREILNED